MVPACRVARAEVRVLITGPNGAGKERIAEIVHANSLQKRRSVRRHQLQGNACRASSKRSCSVSKPVRTWGNALAPADSEPAKGGTLFLDEIGDLPLAGQVKLLRVLETGQFEMLGSSTKRTTNARVISATNVDPPALIREGRFREDLYYRLNVIEIFIAAARRAPRRHRALARHFFGTSWQLSADAQSALLAHDWPGNVRELRNSIERAKLPPGRDNRVGRRRPQPAGRSAMFGPV